MSAQNKTRREFSNGRSGGSNGALWPLTSAPFVDGKRRASLSKDVLNSCSANAGRLVGGGGNQNEKQEKLPLHGFGRIIIIVSQ